MAIYSDNLHWFNKLPQKERDAFLKKEQERAAGLAEYLAEQEANRNKEDDEYDGY